MNEREQRIVERIRKLLRLGRGTGYRLEAEAAVAKAREIAAEAGVEMDGIDIEREAVRITHEAGGVRRRSFVRKLTDNILDRHFGVRVYGSPEAGEVFVGPRVNIAIARHVQAYLLRECGARWREHERRWGFKAARKMTPRRHAWTVGFFAGIEHVLEARPVRNDNAEISRAIERYVGARFRIHEQTEDLEMPDGRYNADLALGFGAGKSTRIDRPVEAAEARRAVGAWKRLTLRRGGSSNPRTK